jgi:hypothetical protein
MLILVNIRNSLGTRNPYMNEFGQNFIPVMDIGFLVNIFFLHGYRFGK